MSSDVFFALLTVPYFAIPIVVGYILHKFIKEDNKKKKRLFALICGFLCFPILVPAGTIAAIPFANVVAFPMLLFPKPLEAFSWYGKLWFFNIPSFMITTFIMRGIAAMIFYEKKI